MRLRILIPALAVIFVRSFGMGQDEMTSRSATGWVSVETVFVHSGISPYIIQRHIHAEHSGRGKVYVRDYDISPMDGSSSKQSISDTSIQLNDDSILDVNFDGYKDLMLDQDSEEPVNMGQSSDVYLFNPSNRKFEYSKAFSGFSELSVNPIDSTLRSQILFLGGIGEDYQIYKVKNSSPVLIQHEYRDGDNYTKEVLDDGEVVVAEQYARSPASSGWMKLTHRAIAAGKLRPVEEWIAQRLDDDPTPQQLKTGIVKELRWGKYLVKRQAEFTYKVLSSGTVRKKSVIHEMRRGKWATVRK